LQLRHWLVLGTTNGWVPNVLTAIALSRIESAPAALIHATTPMIVALMAIPLLKEERAGPRTIAGLLLGFCGIAVILGPDALAGRVDVTIDRLCLKRCELPEVILHRHPAVRVLLLQRGDGHNDGLERRGEGHGLRSGGWRGLRQGQNAVTVGRHGVAAPQSVIAADTFPSSRVNLI